jgi:hypothetical protein
VSNSTDETLCAICRRRREPTDEPAFLNLKIGWSEVVGELPDVRLSRIDSAGWLCRSCTFAVVGENPPNEVRCAICRRPGHVKDALRVDMSGCVQDDTDEMTTSMWVCASCHKAVHNALAQERQESEQ